MAMFIEVESVDRGCKVIINMDEIIEIAPLREGGCNIFYPDSAAVGGKNSMRVKDNYSMFKQFVLETVSEDMIRSRIEKMGSIEKQIHNVIEERIAPQAVKQDKPKVTKPVANKPANTTAGLE